MLLVLLSWPAAAQSTRLEVVLPTEVRVHEVEPQPLAQARLQAAMQAEAVAIAGKASSIRSLHAPESNVSVQFDQVSRRQALERVAVLGNVRLAYSRDLVSLSEPISLRLEGATLQEAVRAVLRGSGLEFELSSHGYLIITPLTPVAVKPPAAQHQIAKTQHVHAPLSLQMGTIAGTVTDSTTGEPLPGVNVVLAGTQQGAATDAQGHFIISSLEAGTYDLMASFIGYTTKRIEGVTVRANDTTRVDIAMSPARLGLEEVVVVGYGTQERENVTGSVEEVSVEAFDNRALTNAANALQGQVAGLTVITRSGEPGADDGTIRIRGIGTLGGGGKNSPLVLVDGIPTSLSDVAPSDIESITVLKDAAAAAIYGVRAANGVILVTTKRGPEGGEMQFSYSGYMGVQTATRLPNFLGSADYARLKNEALTNVGREPIYTQEDIAKFENGNDPVQYPNTPWLDLLLDPAFQQSHYFSLAGGVEQIRYRTSFRYLNQDGLIPGITLNEYNVRANLDAEINDRLSLSISLAGVRELEDRPYNGSSWLMGEALRIPPTLVNRYPDGTWEYYKGGNNPIRKALQDGFDTWEETRLRGSAMAEYELLEGLTAKARFGIDTYSGLRTAFRKRLTFHNFETGDVELITAPPYLLNWNRYDQAITIEGFLNYEQIFGEHHVKGLLGYSQESFRRDWFEATRELPSNLLHELEAGNPSTQENDGSAESWALRSVFGRVQYSLLDRYLLEANLRYDGTSRFPQGNRYGLFPSFSVGWRLSEEPFFAEVEFIEELKLRGSWGRLGNQKIGVYPYQSTYQYGVDYPLGGELVSGAVEARLPNRAITWETTTMTDVGVDMELFEGQLGLTVDYFYKVTDGILLTLPIPWSVGIGAPPQNAASVMNRGWEFAGEYRGTIGAFSYGIAGNLSLVHNEITDMMGTGLQITGTYGNVVDDPINSLYGYEAMGLFQSEEQVENHAFQNPATAPGDIIYKDQNGDGIIDAEDRVYLGSYFPGVTYGMTFTADYEGFDLRIFLQGVGQTKGYLRGRAMMAFHNGSKVLKWHLDRWTPENQGASYPRLTIGLKHNFEASSFWVQDASYLRIKNIQLGYTLPESLLSRFGVSRLRIYVNADNLYTFTGFRGYDPEAPLGGGRFYPQVATYTFGINLSI